MGAAVALVLLGLAVGQASPREGASSTLLVEVFASNGFINEWHIIVSTEGLVRIAALRPEDRDRVYKLTPAALAELKSMLVRERAGELSGEVGVAVIDGPMHMVRVNEAGTIKRFELFSTPRAEARTVATARSVLGRAVRVCEHVRRLSPGAGAILASCIDEY